MATWREYSLALASCAAMLVLGEVALRALDGYRIMSPTLVPTRPPQEAAVALQVDRARQLDRARHHVGTLPVAPGVDRALFDVDPDPLAAPEAPDPDVNRRYWKHHGAEIESIYAWNRVYVLNKLCVGSDRWPALSDIFTFDPPSHTEYPRYRFPPGQRLPSGLVSNNFGWRGAPISLNRPPRTIRIAFVGASTTVNPHYFPASYPEHVGAFLNAWSRRQNLDVNFEIINAGREGLDSTDFTRIVADEIVPADPDLVVYYEGANQFWPVEFVDWPGGKIPPKAKRTFREPSWPERHSAVARRVAGALGLLSDPEPNKAFGPVHWPATLDEFDPDVSVHLPLNLPTILADMGAIERSLDRIGASLVVSSFVWLAYDGMRLELPRDQGIYNFLNDTYAPFPYAHLRRMADFQNRTLRKFATLQDLPFLDVAGLYPQDPELFEDAVHMSPAGVKLHAWIAFNALVPIVQDRVRTGSLPRPPRNPPLAQHPAFATPARLETKAGLMQACAAGMAQRDRQRLQDVADIRRALEQFRVENGRYPALPSGAGWGQCSGGIPTNWIPDRADFNWSRRYLERMPREPRTACYYPFDPAHVGNTQYMYFSDGPHRYALIVGLEDPSLPGTLRGRGAASVPPWLLRVAGSADKWWGGTYVVTSESSEAMAQ